MQQQVSNDGLNNKRRDHDTFARFVHYTFPRPLAGNAEGLVSSAIHDSAKAARSANPASLARRQLQAFSELVIDVGAIRSEASSGSIAAKCRTLCFGGNGPNPAAPIPTQ